MIPRECDNDDCDYDETGRWVHVLGCDGPMPPISPQRMEEIRAYAEAHPNSIAAMLLRGGGH